jgi:hypothetical protein
MALGDAVLGCHALTLVVYACFMIEVAHRRWLRSRRHALPIFGAMLLGFCFYPRTLAGLTACYVAAVPFFANTLLGDAFFVSLLFGTLAVAEGRVPALRERAIPVPA